MTPDERLVDLLLRQEELRAQGRSVTPAELCGDCPELRDEVERRLRGLQELEPLFGTPDKSAPASVPTPEEQSPKRSTAAHAAWTAPDLRYRPVRFHAKGGLGEVHVAQDQELHRDVALKRIQPDRSHDEDGRRRFLREAVITGRLEHPGIVPVHGLVHDSNGEPCYAMRLIQGETLQKAIWRFHEADKPGCAHGERSLGLRQLLGRFVAVCNTLAYAHSRGVVHRDLKPDNIMLGPYGETLVVDWGLAKALAGDEGVGTASVNAQTPGSLGERKGTQFGEIIGTPAYMSPEQSTGKVDQVGPASDIYSLGATLYVLLTGKAPFEGTDIFDILLRVTEGHFPPPGQVKANVPAALEAVCLKAMALRPEERYATALDLAGDIEHWLADEPAAAYRDPLPVRLGRWTRRHRTLVTGVAAAVGVGVLALTLATGLLTAANQSERAARTLAEQRHQEAVANLQLARQAVDEYSLKVSQDPRLREGFRTLRKELLQTVVPFYEKFVAQQSEDAEVQAELGRACLRLGDITQEIGDPDAAIARYQQAQDIFAQLARDYPDKTTYQVNLAKSHVALGRLYDPLKKGNTAKAEEAYREALRLWQHLADEHPEAPEYQSGLAATYGLLEILYNHTGRREAAEQAAQKALDLFRRLAQKYPDEPRYQRDLSQVLTRLGAVYAHWEPRRPADVERVYREALAIRQRLAKGYPNDALYQSDLAGIHNSLGLMYRDAKKPPEAKEFLQTAVNLSERLVDDYPEVTGYQHGLAKDLNDLGLVYGDLGKWPEHDKYLRDALAIRKRLAKRRPEVLDYAFGVGDICCNLGHTAMARGQLEKALEWYAQAIPPLEKVLQKEPREFRSRITLRNVHWYRAQTLSMRGRYAEAIPDWDRAIELNGAPGWTLRSHRALTLALAGDHARAAAEADDMAKDPSRKEDQFCSLAAIYSQAVRVVAKDGKLSQTERDQLAALYARRAVELLRKVAATGYFKKPTRIQPLKEKDPNLIPLRSREEFKQLLREIEKQAEATP
jgi:serine/threonine-protein kinase